MAAYVYGSDTTPKHIEHMITIADVSHVCAAVGIKVYGC